MDTPLSKSNRLYWLGRYNERVYTSVKYMMMLYDRTIDGSPVGYADICRQLDIDCTYNNVDDFFHRYLFDVSNPDSVARSADNMLGNGMVLRETISSVTLSYLQMAFNALNLAADSPSPAVELQWVLDDIMAFRGSYEDYIVDETTRNIIQCGICVERVSMFLRLDINPLEADTEMKKLVSRMYKAGLPMDPVSQAVLIERAVNRLEFLRAKLLAAVESLFIV